MIGPDRLFRFPAAEEEKSHSDEYGETDGAADDLPGSDGAGLGGWKDPFCGAVENFESVRLERVEIPLLVACQKRVEACSVGRDILMAG